MASLVDAVSKWIGEEEEDECTALRRRLGELKRRREETRRRSEALKDQLVKLAEVKRMWLERLNAVEGEANVLTEELQSLQLEKEHCLKMLETLMQINVANDCFYIWHMGPFATINGFKLGRLPAYYPVEWSDVNAGLGQAMLLLCTIVERAHFRFRSYILQPMGSFSRIVKADDPSNRVNLYYEENFSFFPKRNFNAALTCFLKCVQEFGDYVEHQDPTLRLPYRIEDGKISDIPITFTVGYEEQWTKALKYLMTNLKWLVSWASKHLIA